MALEEVLMLKGLNHLTLSVSDLQASIDFYQNLLGMKLCMKWDKGAYLECGSLWLCLSLHGNRFYVNPESSDYTHYAFTIDKDDFNDFVAILKNAKVMFWQENESEGDSCYFLDPDGHKLEVHVGDLSQRLKWCVENGLTVIKE